MKPLFIPLKTEYYEKFESGEKTDELRKYGSRWNEKTCPKGRRAVLSKGYGTKSRMTGCVSRFKKQHGSLFGSTYRADILKVYGTLDIDIACISFENLKPQKIEREKNEVLIEHTEHGRKSEYIECPFCRLVTKIYVVSLDEKSRNCECGALHLRNGMTEKKFVAQ